MPVATRTALDKNPSYVMSDLYLNFGKQVPLLTLLFQFLCLAHFFCYFKTAKFIPEVKTTIRLPNLTNDTF